MEWSRVERSGAELSGSEAKNENNGCLCESVHVPWQLKEQISRSAIYSVNVVVSIFAVEANSLIHCC